MSGGEPPILDYHTPQTESPRKFVLTLVLVERIIIGMFAAIATLISAACMVSAFYTDLDGIYWLTLGLILVVIAYLLWRAVGVRIVNGR